MITHQISLALRNRHLGEEWAFFSELRTRTGIATRAGYIDAYAAGLWQKNKDFIAYEVKQSRGDFKADIKEFATKQEVALRNSTQFFYVCQHGLIKPEEVPEMCGLMYLNEGGLRVQKVAPIRVLKDNCLDIDFTRSLLRSSGDQSLTPKNSLWKYAGKEVSEEQLLEIAKELGHIKNEYTVKWEVDKKVNEEKIKAWAVLQKFAEATDMGRYFEDGTIDEIATRMIKSYKEYGEKQNALERILYNSRAIKQAAYELEKLTEKDKVNE
jgi:hypothetical protein